MPEFDNISLNTINAWVLTSGLKIAGIIIVSFLIRKFSHIFIEKFIRKMVVSNRFLSKNSEKQRGDTLIKIINSTVSVLVFLIAGLMILQELGIEIGPILAAAGIAGLAFGFGGQYLIRDIISGLFITLENQ
jgi:small conductance mechanosensitive channel